MAVRVVGGAPFGVRRGGGFDFDSFDADLARAVEGTLESSAPATWEQSEGWDLVGDSAHSIRDHVGSYVANVAGFDWENVDAVEEMFHEISGELLERELGQPVGEVSINDRVWDEIEKAAEHAGYEYDGSYHGEFVPFESRGVQLDTSIPPSVSAQLLPRVPPSASGSLPPMRPGFQGSSVDRRLPGYQALPPSMLGDLYMRMAGQEPPRIGRAHPERSDRGRRVKPNEPLSEAQKKINAKGIEDSRKVLEQIGSSSGMSTEQKLALAAALVGAGLLTVGSGGVLGPALLGGAGMAALGN